MAITLEVDTRLNERSARDTRQDAERYFERAGQTAGESFNRNLAQSIEKGSQQVQKSYEKAVGASEKLQVAERRLAEQRERREAQADRITEAEARLADLMSAEERDTKKVAAAEAELIRLRDQHSRTTTQVVAASANFSRAKREESSALRETTKAFREYEQSAATAATSVSGHFETIGEAGRQSSMSLMQMGTAMGSLSRLAGPVGVSLLASGIGYLGGVAASASGAIGLLPGAAVAAGSAFGTLKLATLGFGDALKEIGDPEKFAEALQQLSPNAQQAALAIQSMMPALTRLKDATQDALFAGIGPQLNGLVDQFLPTVQTLTTGVAGAFNTMFTELTQSLSTPAMQFNIGQTVDNIVTAFQNLGPAIAPITQAFGDLIASGSSFLPGLAQGAASAAESFASFISEARQSGQLNEWIERGVTSLGQLSEIAFDVGRAFMALTPAGEQILPNMVSAMESIATQLQIMTPLVVSLTPAFWPWHQALEGVSGVVGTIGNGFQTVATVIQSIPGLLEPLRTAIDVALGPLDETLELAARVLGISGPAKGAMASGGGAPLPKPGSPTNQSAIDRWSEADAAGKPGSKPNGLGPGMYRRRDGSIGYVSPPSANAGGPVTNLTDAAAGSSAAPPPQFDPSQWQNLPTPAAPIPTYTETPSGPGAYQLDPQAVVSAENQRASTQESLSEARLRLLELEADTNVKQSTLVAARNNISQLERQLTEDEAKVIEARQGKWEKADKQLNGISSSLGEFGASLDQDFGISRGLPGIAENITKFVGNLVAAPFLAKMNAIADANPSKGGHGLVGILGARGAFGPKFTGVDSEAQPSAIGPAALQPDSSIPNYGNPNVAAMMSLAQRSSGNVEYGPASDLVNGLADCSGSISDLYEVLTTGSSSPERKFTTVNFASDAEAAKLGFQPGFMPGALNVGVNPYPGNSGHMAATLPNGVNFEGGGGTGGGAQYGGSASGALDSQFEKQYYLPLGPGAPTIAASTPVAAPTTPTGATPPNAGFGGQIPIPLPVTIVGGVMPGAAPVGVPAAAPGGSPVGTAGTTAGVGIGPAPAPTAAPMIPGAVPSIAGGPGTGAGFPGLTGPPAANPTQIGGLAPPGGSGGGGGIGITPGGSIDTALQVAGMMAPGMGQAAATGAKLASRAIEYGGQVASIGVQGLMETFLPTGGSELAQNNWLTRIVGGLAGAAPAIPNMAGEKTPPNTTGQQHGTQGGQPPGPTNGVYVDKLINQGNDGMGVANDIAWHQTAANTGAGPVR